MLRPGLLLALTIPLLAGCSTFAFPPSRALDDLAAMRRAGYPSFKGLGRVEVDEKGRKFIGIIHLALDGERFRMEVSHPTGKTILAVAGEEGNILRLDPDTGAKTELNEGFPLAGNNGAPWALVGVMVTGSPPPVSKIKSIRVEDGVSIVAASEPSMTFHYRDGRLLMLEGGSPLSYTFHPGPLTEGPLAPYLKWFQVTFRGSKTMVEWDEVEQGAGFPDGFFRFEDFSGDF